MSYNRVIPRDLFNEANLLKCYGQLYLRLEAIGLAHRLAYHGEGEGDYFHVSQSDADGSLRIDDVTVHDADGLPGALSRPLNSREPWPLWLSREDDEFLVFDENGTLTTEMLVWLGWIEPT